MSRSYGTSDRVWHGNRGGARHVGSPMGSTRQHTIRILTTVAAIALAVSACSGRDDDQSADDAAAEATNAAPADAATGAPALSEAEVATDEAAGGDASGG